VLVRNAIFQLVRALARKDWSTAASMVTAAPGGDPWTPARIEESLSPFFAEHAAIRLDPGARSPENSRLGKSADGVWDLVQVVCDSDGDDDWVLTASVDLEASAREGRPVLALRSISR